MFRNIYKDRKVLITGHTGFKGTWLTMWLLELGAEVIGYSNKLPTNPSHFSALEIEKNISHNLGDIRNYKDLKKVFDTHEPEIVFHLAAQPLVRKSYQQPSETIEVNTMGVVNVLEIARVCDYIKSIVIITSDKCYDNVEWIWGYRENDRLGGEDPYSASKGCAELIAKTYMKSFFQQGDTYVATARAGNVIGGGDWAEDRIVADSMIAWSENKKVAIRSPYATRPWQHVLEPLSGYLQLAAELYSRRAELRNQSFNLGPDADVNKTVEELLLEMKKNWDLVRWEVEKQRNQKMKEAGLLKLSCDKANNFLKWYPTLSFEQTIELTVLWYKQYYDPKGNKSVYDLTLGQINEYCEVARIKELKWTI
ncbi:CDP-glucose 4,6-dehydratase [Akkermansiaceae bacterium]|nr:CDP-glucose 4,6-dehydratase [Akkermansiaceae bacterium]|tara:strand:+ start:758 stop:1855 length:1098 start_codon:yes stop_codon:yes gene_type:complete